MRLRKSADGINFQNCLSVSNDAGALILADNVPLHFTASVISSTAPYTVRAVSDSLIFSKKSSDTTLAEGTRFVFDTVGGANAGSPFWQGVHHACSLVRETGASRYPRISFYFS